MAAGLDRGSRRTRRRRSIRILAAAVCGAVNCGRARADIGGFDAGGFTLNGGATIGSGGVLQLTDTSTTFEARSAFFGTAQSVASFTAQLTYTLSGTAGLGAADGIAFVLSNPANGATALGGAGGQLGYGGISNSVAVELNVWQSSGTALGMNGSYGLYTPTTPAVDLRALSSPVHVTLAYDGSVLRETLVQGTSSLSTGYSFLNIASIVGSASAYAGFTGATGLGLADQRISNFSFQNNVLPPSFLWNVRDGDFGFAGNWNLNMTAGSAGVADMAYLYYPGGGTAHVTTSQGPLQGLTLGAANVLSIEAGGNLYVSGSLSADVNDPNAPVIRLADGGTLHVRHQELLGNYFRGTLYQTGGSNVIDSVYDSGLFVGGGGSGAYYLSGGTVQTSYETIQSNGLFAQTGGDHWAGELHVGGTCTLSAGALHTSLVYIAPNGRFDQSAGTHTVSTELNIGDTLDVFGASGTYRLSGSGVLTVAGSEYVGSGGVETMGSGTFEQAGGTHLVSANLVLGRYASSGNWPFAPPPGKGVYSMSNGATLRVGQDEVVGYGGIGTFVQTGGDHRITGGLALASGSSSTGSFALSGQAVLAVGADEHVGVAGRATFSQTGGTHSITGQLLVGGYGTYTLAGTGSLMAAGETIGGGSFNQSGGTNLTGSLSVSSFSPSYMLSGDTTVLHVMAGYPGGTAGAGTESINDGSFQQSGGTHLIDGNLIVGGGNFFLSVGTFTLSGGSVSALNVYLGVSPADTIGASPATTGPAAASPADTFSGGGGVVIDRKGILNVSGGLFSALGTLFIASPGTSSGTVSSGTVSLSGGVLTATQTINNGAFRQTGGCASLGPVSGTGSISLGGGASTASLTVQRFAQSSVTVSNNAALTILSAAVQSTNTAGTLMISGSGTLDLGNSALVVDRGPAPATNAASVVQTLYQQIISAYNSPNPGVAPGDWKGTGITSALAQADASLAATARAGLAIGIWDSTDAGIATGQPAHTVRIALTELGDANGDGFVDNADFALWRNNFGTGDRWSQGDFNYDGFVDNADFAIWRNHFGEAVSFGAETATPSSVVPEPASVWLAAGAAVMLLGRRRRRRGSEGWGVGSDAAS